jgi:hypothetical protein
MAQRSAGGRQAKLVKKDRQAVQRLGGEINDETRTAAVAAVQRNHNRDAARGDWDRASRHHDEGLSRDEALEPPRPEQLYPERAHRRKR